MQGGPQEHEKNKKRKEDLLASPARWQEGNRQWLEGN